MYQHAMESAMQPERADENWSVFTDSLHSSLESLEQEIDDVAELREICQDEWCTATECMLGELTHSAFAISEPHWSSSEDSNKLKQLKRRIHDLHIKKADAVD